MNRSFKRFLFLYIDGFRNMGLLGRRLWLIIFIKLFIMFAILKLFFFPDVLKSSYSNDQERSNYVLEHITKQTKNDGTH